MKTAGIDKVCFIGAGTMGCFNSLMASVAGHRSVVYDLLPAALSGFRDGQQEMADYLVEAGFFKAGEIQSAMSLIDIDDDLVSATQGADLVSESVAETLEVKRQVHGQLDKICPPSTLITTNTSSLLVSDIETALVQRERFAALHSHLGSSLIDIVGSSTMLPESIERLQNYVKSINGIPLVLKKENEGYVLNAMLGPLLTMAMMLVIAGVANKEQVDRAWMSNTKAAIGLFGMMDMFGLNIIYDNWQKPQADDQARKLQLQITEFLKPYIEAGSLGIKKGRGFYDYPDPPYQHADFLSAPVQSPLIFQALSTVLIENAINLVRKNIVEYADVDRAWIAATQLEKGPFGILDSIGLDNFISAQAELVALGLSSKNAVQSVRDFLKPLLDVQALGEKSSKGFYNYPNPAYKLETFTLNIK